MEYHLMALEKGKVFSLMTDKSLENLDRFTMQFGNNNDLNNFFNRLYNKTIKFDGFKIFRKSDDEKKYIRPLDIRYKEDRYYAEDVILKFQEYLTSNPNNIKYSNIRFMNSRTIRKFTEEHYLSDDEIRLLVKNYLTSYNKIREVYFEMKTTPNRSKITFDNRPKDINYESDDHNLQILLEKGNIDEIMKNYSLEDLQSMLKNSDNKKPIVDGLESIKKR